MSSLKVEIGVLKIFEISRIKATTSQTSHRRLSKPRCRLVKSDGGYGGPSHFNAGYL
jgi:hypothetical protein